MNFLLLIILYLFRSCLFRLFQFIIFNSIRFYKNQIMKITAKQICKTSVFTIQNNYSEIATISNHIKRLIVFWDEIVFFFSATTVWNYRLCIQYRIFYRIFSLSKALSVFGTNVRKAHIRFEAVCAKVLIKECVFVCTFSIKYRGKRGKFERINENNKCYFRFSGFDI